VNYGRIILLVFLLTTLKGTAQQDPIFTQYMYNGQVINPAYAGMWEKIGFTALVRKQWAGIHRAPLTEAISIHSPLGNERVGMGLNIINDNYGREERLSVLLDYAFEVSLTPQRRLRLGLKFGFVNYKNPLTDYLLYPDNEYDRAFAEDIDLSFLPNVGVGAFLYEDNYYVGLSVPKIVQNEFKDNYHNYSTTAEVRTAYLTGGYVFQFYALNKIIFKPTLMVRATIGAPIEFDLAANVMLKEQLWLGVMLRSGNAVSFMTQWIMNNNLRLGFAMDVTFNEIYPYQNGTYEFTIGYDIDFFGRSYMRAKYF
jgi:type IX secretion system PorP/SprF family membrane protein